MTVADARQRQQAIDPGSSFCVSAPAGSGKTELLIQRYLGLLARVERPEQVLAITFTRKAAAEMRGRVVAALQAARAGAACDGDHQRVTRCLAEAALEADERHAWHLERNIARFNIKTIDSFCGGLIRQMPVLSEFGGQAALLDDASQLYAEAVVELFRQVEQRHPVATDLAALMLHFDNNWERLQELLTRMLARREQWRPYLGLHHAPEESEAYLVAAVQALVASELASLGERLAPYRTELLALWQYAEGNLGGPVPAVLPGNTAEDIAAWRALRGLLLTRQGSWRRQVTKADGFPTGKGSAQDHKERLKALLAELATVDGLEQLLADVTFLPEMLPGSASWQLLVHLSRVLPLLAAQLLLVFQRHGAVDHSQVALSALQALGDDEAPTELALRLDYRIEHILVDEFQDTAINQYELLRLLTRGWGDYNAANPQAPRTIMVVGDGMQSIYGFRGANVGLFLKARQRGFNGVRLQALDLQCNFRSDAPVVDWVNASFRSAFPAEDDVNRGRVRYTPATAVRPPTVDCAVSAHAFSGERALEQEVDFLCKRIAAACADPDYTSIAVLGRTRNQLQPILAGMRQRGIAYSAQEMDSLATSPLVGDLLQLCRALANPGDRLAWMALLRAPWCGLQLADLHHIAQWGAAPQHAPLLPLLAQEALHDTLSADGRDRVTRFCHIIEWARGKRDRLGLRAWLECTWLKLGGPATAATANELADAESFLQLLEQADREGLGLDTRWLARRLEQQYMNAGEAGGKVQVMTLHKAKGLEFDMVILPQLARSPRPDGRQLMLWDEHGDLEGERRFLLAADDHSGPGEPTLYNYLQQRRAEKNALEGTRLLYVGATRAIRQLLLSAGLREDPASGELLAPPQRSLLGPIWDSFQAQMIRHDTETPPAPTTAVQRRPLVRLCHPAAAAAASPVAEGANVPVRAANLQQRCVGTVVHLALEDLSRLERLPVRPGDTDRQRWRAGLASLGLWGDRLEDALAEVAHSVTTTLAPQGRGRWLLRSDHQQARSEWALTSTTGDGVIRDMVIDRTFVDRETGVRWLIDYKTSQPEAGQALEMFLRDQAEAYRDQLLGYRQLLRALGDEPVRCALYFTALGHLHHLEELDLEAAPGDTTP